MRCEQNLFGPTSWLRAQALHGRGVVPPTGVADRQARPGTAGRTGGLRVATALARPR